MLFLVLFFLVSPIAKSILEKNSQEWLGRRVSIENVWINIFTGSISIAGVEIFEKDEQTIFANIKQIKTSVSLSGLMASNYKFKTLSIDEMSLSVIQLDSSFNFTDLVEKFRDTSTTAKNPVDFELKNITLKNSTISFTNVQRNFTQKLNQISFSCPLIAQNLEKYSFQVTFKDAEQGNFKAKLDLNARTKEYTLSAISEEVNLGGFSPCIRDFIAFGEFKAVMSTDLHIKGNFNTPEDLSCQGAFSLKNMSLSDVNATSLAACESFEVEIDSIDTKSQFFSFTKGHIEKPYLFYEENKTGNNFDALMKIESMEGIEESSESASNPLVLLAQLIKRTFQDVVVQNYSFKKLSLSNGEVKYVDKTLPEPFNFTMKSLNVSSDAITSQQERVIINFNSFLNKSGKAEGLVTFDPAFTNFDIDYTIEDFLVTDLNPYSKFYTAHALQNGKMYYKSATQIRNGMLTSQNDFKIRNIDVSRKLKVYAPEYYLPLRLAISILKDVHGDVQMEIPITGNLKDPNYKLGKTIWKAFKNLIFKIAASPYKILTKNSAKKNK